LCNAGFQPGSSLYRRHLAGFYFLNNASNAFLASCGVAFASNVRSTKTAAVKKLHSFLESFGEMRVGIGFVHSYRELVLKNEQFVHVWRSAPQFSQVESVTTPSRIAGSVFPQRAHRMPDRAVPPSRIP
jgi:hypothetical protein